MQYTICTKEIVLAHTIQQTKRKQRLCCMRYFYFAACSAHGIGQDIGTITAAAAAVAIPRARHSLYFYIKIDKQCNGKAIDVVYVFFLRLCLYAAQYITLLISVILRERARSFQKNGLFSPVVTYIQRQLRQCTLYDVYIRVVYLYIDCEICAARIVLQCS